MILRAKVARFVERRRLLSPGDRIGAAVSGGADSVALLYVLRELFPEAQLGVVHCNHCLRGAESEQDEAFVRALARRLELSVSVRRQDAPRRAGGCAENLEKAARDCRYRFFCELLAAGAYDKIATAHTRSDQAETVLFRLLRGAAGPGLSAVRPLRNGAIVRPMLDVSRDEVEAYLTAQGISWREDSSNNDMAFARNRLRRELLPQLKREWNPQIERTLAKTADWHFAEQLFWEARTDELVAACASREPRGLLLQVEAVRKLHPAEQRRLLRRALAESSSRADAVGFDHVEAVRAAVHADAGSVRIDLPGLRVERSFDRILLRQPGACAASFDVPLRVPGRTEAPGTAAIRIETRFIGPSADKKRYNATDWAFLDWDRMPKPLRLRNRRPGDRYRPAGRTAAKKLKRLFQENRIHSWRREGWPVIAASADGGRNEVIVWTRAFGPAAEFAAGAESRNRLSIRELDRSDEEKSIERPL